jgi:general secretion pathway protein A
MYEEYYGFAQPPFNLTPDPRFLYRSTSHDLALQQLHQAIRRHEGFIILTGDIGTGKTTLCRTLLEQLDRSTFTALLLNPFLSVEELLREVLLSYGVVSRDALRTGRLATASKHELVRTLHEFLLSLVPIGGSAVLIIDEAQHLSADVLEEIRILSNLETDQQKLLQIIIVGQLNLLDVLRSAKLRQLDQRISIRCSLQPLSRDEVEAYITHRLSVARGSTSVTFTPASIDLVHTLSGGVPRLINLLCDRALMAGREAQAAAIDEGLVAAAARTLGLNVPDAPARRWGATVRRRPVPRAGAAAIALVAIVGIAASVAVGTPSVFFGHVELPPAASRALPAPLAAAAIPLDAGQRFEPPPFTAGPFTVLIGTFVEPRTASLAVTRLRAEGLPVYTVDVAFAENDVRRRILVGRYATRGEARALQQKLAGDFPGTMVIFGWQERLRRPQTEPLALAAPRLAPAESSRSRLALPVLV